jgi:ketosteroid isomerase-like protein
MVVSRNRSVVAAFVAVVMLVLAAAPRASAQAANPDEVLKLQKQFQDACVAADGPTLTKLMADDAVFVHGNAAMQTKAQFIDAIVSGHLPVSQYDLKEPKVIPFDGGAIVTGVVDFGIRPPPNSTNPPLVLHFRGSAVWVRTPAGWRLLFDQDTVIQPPPAAAAAPPASH